MEVEDDEDIDAAEGAVLVRPTGIVRVDAFPEEILALVADEDWE